MHDLVTSYEYPLFEGGQTLTAAELNALQEFLHDRDRLVGRMVGFGVNCGLGGTVAKGESGFELEIDAGLALDQVGEPLMLTDPWVVELPPPDQRPTYDFIDPKPGGYSVVLGMTDVSVPAPDCGEVDCTAHADLHTVGVEVRTVAGRVSGTYMDFALEGLLDSKPLLLNQDGSLASSYSVLRDAIADRLTNGTDPLVDPALIADLRGTKVDATEAVSIQGYKAGWLNLVLFATLDLLRARTLFTLACDRETVTPGVVLGWVHFEGGVWLFDCRYRHAWEPPRGFSEALLGGSCTDPLKLYRDQLEALLDGYAPPEPAPPGPVTPPTECPPGTIRIFGRCLSVYYPPYEAPDDWYHHWVPQYELPDRLGPLWDPPPLEFVEKPWLVYNTKPWDVFEDGVIGVGHYTGQPAGEVGKALADHVRGHGGVADVRVVDVGGEREIEGFQHAGAFSPSDTVVVLQGADHEVVGFGRVAAISNVGRVGNALPAATEAVATAQATATELRGLVDGVEGRFDHVGVRVDGLAGQLGTLQGTVGELDLGGFENRMATLEGKVDVIQRLPGSGGGRGGSVVLDVDFGRGLVEFTETAVAAMRSLGQVENPHFERYVTDTERAQSELEVAVAADQPDLVIQTTMKTLRSMRTMLKASGAPAALGSQLDAQLRELGGLLG